MTKQLIALFLLITVVVSKRADWSHPSDLVSKLKDEIFRFDQMEQVGQEFKCNHICQRVPGFSFFLPGDWECFIDCDHESYQPPTAQEAEIIVKKIPDYEGVYFSSLKLKKYNEKIPVELRNVIVTLWNKMESLDNWRYLFSRNPEGVSWEQIVKKIQD